MKSVMNNLQASSLVSLSEADVIRTVSPLFSAAYQTSGVLASVSMAQFILESGYGKSELCQKANNAFGMKTVLSGNKWSGSTWNGEEYSKKTQEQREDGTEYTVTAAFRKYGCLEDSIADHSAYLLGARNGKALRYKGLKGCNDYKKAAQIIKGGGYATDVNYVDKLCGIVEKWNLTQYDVAEEKVAGVDVAEIKMSAETEAFGGETNGAETGSDTKTDAAEDDAKTDTGSDSKPEDNTKAQPESTVATPILYGKLKTMMNIRKGPGVSAEKITVYKKNTIIEVLEVCDNGWYRIRCKESPKGFAYVSNADGMYAYTGRSLYTVKTGDTLWRIAGEKLGNPKRNPEIKAANGLASNYIRAGMVLLIP